METLSSPDKETGALNTVVVDQEQARRVDDTDLDESANEKVVPATNRRKLIAGWLLALTVALSIVWVCLFTTLSTHSDINRDAVYDTFATKYFPEKAGARTFTYLGVFYLWIGALTYTSLYFGIRFPKPSYRMVRTFRVPLLRCNISTMEAFVVLLFVSVQIATLLARVFNRFEIPWWPTERVWYEVSKTFGKLLAATILIILFPISKNCFWWDLFNFQFERAVKLHRWIAWAMVWLVSVHAVTAIVPLIMVGEFKSCMWPNQNCEKPGGWETYQGHRTSKIYTYGWIALLFYVPLVITSLPWFRRNKFEWFYYTHFLFIPFLIMLHLHYHDMIYFSAPGLSAYMLDKIVYFFASRRCTKIVNLAIPAPGFVRITIALDKEYSFLPGQWVLINIPAVAFWQWHPMSVASSPGHSTITIDVKVLGDWSEKLSQLAARFDPSKPAHTSIFVDYFHGSSHQEAQGYLNHAVVAMFSGGIGATPMMSALRSLVEQSKTKYPGIRKVVFVWCVKKKSCLELYRAELAKYQSMEKLASGCELDVIVHCTFSEEEDPTCNDFVLSVESATESVDAKSSSVKQGPFSQTIIGYCQQLALTVLTGCGFLLGIFLANFASYEKGWDKEAESLLQLFLAALLAAMFAASVMSYSACRPRSEWSNDEEPDDQQITGDLTVIEHCRPDVVKILAAMEDYCMKNNIRSVGVSVCGPELLVNSVTTTARSFSSSSVRFIVDEETFDW